MASARSKKGEGIERIVSNSIHQREGNQLRLNTNQCGRRESVRCD
jgi:hypothetical protein